MALFRRPSASSAAAQPAPTQSSHTTAHSSTLEPRIRQLGWDLLESSRKNQHGLFSAKFWQDKLMNWAMSDEQFKVQLFRFVDVFPMLNTPEQVHEHLVEYLTQPGVTLPPFLGTAIKAGGFAKNTATKTITGQIETMAGKFIAGVDAKSAMPMLARLRKKNMAFSVDLLGEACVSIEEANEYRERYLDLITTLSEEVKTWPHSELLDTDHLGDIPRANVSIKISSLFPRTSPIAYEHTINATMHSLAPILQAAGERGVFVNFDIEQAELKDLTLDLFMKCCENYDFPAGLAMQAYLQSGDTDAKRVIAWAKHTGKQVTVRLVKGAYWDYEIIHAEQMNWKPKVWTRKCETDACFERMTRLFIDAIPAKPGEGGIKLALGSHNIRSIAAALAMVEERGLPATAIELQMLHGMADPLKAAAIDRKLRVREYIPVGQMIPGMAYLVRRLLENTSNESWLRAGFSDDAPVDILLADPQAKANQPGEQSEGNIITADPHRHQLSAAVPGVGDGQPFMTEPLCDYSITDERENFAAQVKQAAVPQVQIDATVEDANRAVQTAQHVFAQWRDTDVTIRAKCLTEAAAIMRRHRDELSGIMVREAGKPWAEADGDVTEAIDFCEFYAREAVAMFQPKRLGRFIGELNHRTCQPRGVAVVISPWNFPLAICAGMTAAALVTGNPAIVKPAEQTPGIALRMVEIFWQAGVPRDVLQFLPGQGETVGAALVRDPRVAVIAFTGSKAVGLDILRAAGDTLETQTHVKKVVCEMGGKNATIVDSSADLDEAVIGVRDAAFGFAGQKCSACSRAIVLADVHDVFIKRLINATRALRVGNPLDPATDVGPVIDQDAAKKIAYYIALGKEEATLAVGGELHELTGECDGLQPRHCVQPTIFTGVQPHHRIAKEEIFGPVLAVIKADNFDHALEIANSPTYKLTGGLFTRTPSHLEKARREYRVGNLYLNRKITGALVGRQPFGGFGMSGLGTQAGGEDYLLQFVEQRITTENTLRHGFAPMQ